MKGPNRSVLRAAVGLVASLKRLGRGWAALDFIRKFQAGGFRAVTRSKNGGKRRKRAIRSVRLRKGGRRRFGAYHA